MLFRSLYSVLSLPVIKEFLENLLHAHINDLNRSKANASSAELADSPLPDASPAIPNTELSGYEILVAEDNPTNRKVLQKILERAGHRCTLAKDGEEALDIVDKRIFDAIVLDMNMPVVAGPDVARLCRLMHGQSGRVPIIMFSANVTTEARQESIDAGADEFLPKPIQVDLFLNTLDRLIGRFRQMFPRSESRTVIPLRRPVLLLDGEAILNPQALAGIEQMSSDLYFLDELIVEFITENRRMLDALEQSMLAQDMDVFREVVHALKGSALSIGAVAMKNACRRLEKLDISITEVYPAEIMQQLRKIFMRLCEELEEYRQLRQQRSLTPLLKRS